MHEAAARSGGAAAQQQDDSGGSERDLKQLAAQKRASERKRQRDLPQAKPAHSKAPQEHIAGEDFEFFFDTVDYYDQDWEDRRVDLPHQSSPTLQHLSVLLGEVVSLMWESSPGGLANAYAAWPSVRSQIDDLRAHAEAAGTPPDAWTKAVKAMDHIEKRLVDWYSDAAITERASSEDDHAPGEEMAKAALKVAPKAAMSTLELLKQANAAVGSAKEAVGDDVSAATKGLGTSIGAVTFLADTISEGRDVREELEKLKTAGVLEKDATIFDMAHYVASTLKGAVEITKGIMETLAMKKLGPEVAKEVLEGSSMFHELEGASDALGVIAGVYGVTASLIKVVDAIRKGDSRAAIEAGMDAAAGGIGLTSIVLDLGGGPGVVAGLYVFAWKGLIDGVAQMEGTIKALKQERKQRSLIRVLEQAQGAAKSGASMAAAADLAEQESQAKRGSIQEKAHDKFDEKQYALAQETLQWLKVVRFHVGIGEDKPDYPGYYPDLALSMGHEAIDALQSLDGPGLDGDTPYVPLVTQLATTIFGGIDKMVSQIMREDEYGNVKKDDD